MQTAEDVATEKPDVTGEVDVNPSLLTEKFDNWLDALVFALPSLAIAVVIVLIAYIIGKILERLVARHFERRDRSDLGQLMGGLFRWALLITAMAFGATMIFPSLAPGDLFAGLGVSSVAIGFAFKDILQNWLAGLLLLLRRPFNPGDQIELKSHEGTVEHIETRSTRIKTYDGQVIVIPNSEVYTNAILVKTSADVRRSQIDVRIGFKEKLTPACENLKRAMSAVDGVKADPACDVLPWDIGTSHVTLRCRWWTAAFRADVVETHARVVSALHDALNDSSLSRPLETIVHLESMASSDVIPIHMEPTPEG